ncbi:hypothetical protein ACF07M_32555 [Streptomyces globisporus]|uniref:hypothetical protein n=1 Tax=Streptomyces TaxID=1883 RepID=UPI000B0795B9|nr:hypothetical protein [Streptomyces sp. PBSH9]
MTIGLRLDWRLDGQGWADCTVTDLHAAIVPTAPYIMSEREYFACVGKRPGMFVSTVSSFHQLTAFLTGYDQHAIRHGGQGLTGWHEWLVTRRGRNCDQAWLGQVLHIALPEGWNNITHLLPGDECARSRSCSSFSTSSPPNARHVRALGTQIKRDASRTSCRSI